MKNTGSLEKFLNKKFVDSESQIFTYSEFEDYFIYKGFMDDFIQNKMTNSSLTALSDDIEKMSSIGPKRKYGIEPDIRYEKFLAKPNSLFVIFKTKHIPSYLRSEYKIKRIYLYTICIFAICDNDLNVDEWSELSKYVTNLHELTEFEKDRLHAYKKLLLENEYSWIEVQHMLNKISQSRDIPKLIELVFKMICADNKIDEMEKRLLRRIYDFLNIGTKPIRDLEKYMRENKLSINKLEKEDINTEESIDKAKYSTNFDFLFNNISDNDDFL